MRCYGNAGALITFKSPQGSQCLRWWLRFMFIIAFLTGIVIRITATIYWSIRRPLSALKEAPMNWLRQSLCADFFHPPEVVPHETLKGDEASIPRLAMLKNVLEFGGWGRAFIFTLMIIPFIVGYTPSLIYRITFKATSIAYLPFIWVTRTTLSSALSGKIRLKRFTKGELEKTRRVVSYAIFATLAGKLLFIYGWLERSRFEDKFPSARFIESVVIPYGWPWWQITLGVEATLTFILLFFADIALPRIEQQVWQEGWGLGRLFGT